MNYTINGICRGDEKIYIAISLGDVPPTSCITCKAETESGIQIPNDIYSVDSFSHSDDVNSHVIVLADVHAARAKITCCSTNLKTGDSESISFSQSFERAKWLSRINYRTKPSLCEYLRSFDQTKRYKKVSIQFWECIDDDDFDIQRGIIRLPYFVDSQLQLVFLDQNLNHLDLGYTILGDSISTAEPYSSQLMREINFSLRISKTIGTFLVVVNDAMHPEVDSFDTCPRAARDYAREQQNIQFCHAQADQDYNAWLNTHRVKAAELELQRSTTLNITPTFSIIVPVFNTPVSFFNEMVLSVRQQSYEKWQLILVNASPNNTELADAIYSEELADKRIKVLTLDDNKGISENTRLGVTRASGDFICFFDHDDILEPDALFRYAEAINIHPNIDVLYCDEDKMLPDGTFAQPFFKPDFNIDLLRCNNYVCHMLCIKSDLLEQLVLSDSSYDGAQDHNLTLQAAEKAKHFHHIPRVLYHWRVSETSTAANADTKPYASEAGIKAVSNHLKRLGLSATVELGNRPFTYKVRYRIPASSPLVSIIIPTKDHISLLDSCIKSIIDKSTYRNFEILIVENNSEDASTFEYYDSIVTQWPNLIRVEKWPYEFNYSKLVNFGVSKAKGDYLLLLNNDTEVITPEWLEIQLGLISRSDVGAVGVRLLYPDDTIQHAGLALTDIGIARFNVNLPKSNWGYFALSDCTQDLTAVTAACLMTKRCVYEKVGGFSEILQVAFNDVDYCLKVREANYLVVYTPDVNLYHYESISRGQEDNVVKRTRFHQEISYLNNRWAKLFEEGDPYFNPNFSRAQPNCNYYKLS